MHPLRHPVTGLAAALLLAACSAGADDDSASSSAAQTEVGANGKPSCDVRRYGAKGDGVTKDTAAIQAAIDACAGKGGEVHVQSGTFLSGTIRLKSNMTFHVHGGGTIKGSLDRADYPDTNPPTNNSQLSNCKKALVYAEGAKDLHITGTGIIDGGGEAAQWQGGSKENPERTRPMAMFLVQGDGVTIENITVKSSAMWGVVNMETDYLSIKNVTVDSTHGSTRDGFDIVDCHHVVIDSVTVSSGDDSICLKSGVDRGVDDVMVKNSHVLTSGVANGLKIGTATYGPFTNITFDTIDIAHADKAAMAVESVDGSAISNITFQNIKIHDVGTPFFALIGDRGVRPAYSPRRIGSIDGVHFQNITGDGARHEWGSVLSGLSQGGKLHPVSNVTFENVTVSLLGGVGTMPADPAEYAGQYPDPNLWNDVPAAGVYLRHASNVTFTNTTFTLTKPDARPLVDTSDVTALTAPQCDVTFELHTPADRDDSSAYRILGRNTPPAGIGALASDPVGAWSAAAPALGLTKTGAHDFVGHASFPRGASIDYKAIFSAASGAQYEREGLGNRHFDVPNAASANVVFDWQN